MELILILQHLQHAMGNTSSDTAESSKLVGEVPLNMHQLMSPDTIDSGGECANEDSYHADDVDADINDDANDDESMSCKKWSSAVLPLVGRNDLSQCSCSLPWGRQLSGI